MEQLYVNRNPPIASPSLLPVWADRVERRRLPPARQFAGNRVFRDAFRVLLCKHAVVFRFDQATPTRSCRAHALPLGADAGVRMFAVRCGRGLDPDRPHPWAVAAAQRRNGRSAGRCVAVAGRRGALPALRGDAFDAAGFQSHPTCTADRGGVPPAACGRTRPRRAVALRAIQPASSRARQRLAGCDSSLPFRIATGPGRNAYLKPSSPTDRSTPLPAAASADG